MVAKAGSRARSLSRSAARNRAIISSLARSRMRASRGKTSPAGIVGYVEKFGNPPPGGVELPVELFIGHVDDRSGKRFQCHAHHLFLLPEVRDMTRDDPGIDRPCGRVPLAGLVRFLEPDAALHRPFQRDGLRKLVAAIQHHDPVEPAQPPADLFEGLQRLRKLFDMKLQTEHTVRAGAALFQFRDQPLQRNGRPGTEAFAEGIDGSRVQILERHACMAAALQRLAEECAAGAHLRQDQVPHADRGFGQIAIRRQEIAQLFHRRPIGDRHAVEHPCPRRTRPGLRVFGHLWKSCFRLPRFRRAKRFYGTFRPAGETKK